MNNTLQQDKSTTSSTTSPSSIPNVKSSELKFGIDRILNIDSQCSFHEACEGYSSDDNSSG